MLRQQHCGKQQDLPCLHVAPAGTCMHTEHCSAAWRPNGGRNGKTLCNNRKKASRKQKDSRFQTGSAAGSTASNLLVHLRASHDPQHRLQVLSVAAHGPGAQEASPHPLSNGELPIIGDHSCKQGERGRSLHATSQCYCCKIGQEVRDCGLLPPRCSSGLACNRSAELPRGLVKVPRGLQCCSNCLW